MDWSLAVMILSPTIALLCLPRRTARPTSSDETTGFTTSATPRALPQQQSTSKDSANGSQEPTTSAEPSTAGQPAANNLVVPVVSGSDEMVPDERPTQQPDSQYLTEKGTVTAADKTQQTVCQTTVGKTRKKPKQVRTDCTQAEVSRDDCNVRGKNTPVSAQRQSKRVPKTANVRSKPSSLTAKERVILRTETSQATDGPSRQDSSDQEDSDTFKHVASIRDVEAAGNNKH